MGLNAQIRRTKKHLTRMAPVVMRVVMKIINGEGKVKANPQERELLQRNQQLGRYLEKCYTRRRCVKARRNT